MFLGSDILTHPLSKGGITLLNRKRTCSLFVSVDIIMVNGDIGRHAVASRICQRRL